ncbi:IclR family transcriptional regulator [Xanthobacter wiegelii]|uniref:IclR family transcriptional regulator n=1 Tax=Xanthobacter wiegelii TaxID=3119913 RepID=UPI00372C4CF6
MKTEPACASDGTQSIERAVRVLRLLSSLNFAGGMTFAEIQQASGLAKGTLYRIIRALRREGFVERHPSSGKLYLGMDFLALGLASMNRLNLRELARPHLQRLAARTEDTVFLSIRVGPGSVCIDRCDGSFPIKTVTLNVGDHRPLGLGAGALALLAWLDDDEIKDIIGHNARRFPGNPVVAPAALAAAVARSRKAGYAFNDGQMLKSMCAVAIPVSERGGAPFAALSIAAIAERMEPARRTALVEALRQAADCLGAELAARGAQAPKI